MTCQSFLALYGGDAYAEHHPEEKLRVHHFPSFTHGPSRCGSASRHSSFAAFASHSASAGSPYCYFDCLLCQHQHLCYRCCAKNPWTRACATVSSLWAMLRNSHQRLPHQLPYCAYGASIDCCSGRHGAAGASESAGVANSAAWTLCESHWSSQVDALPQCD